MAIFGPTNSATPQFGVQSGPNLAPFYQYLEADDARKGYHEPTMSTKPPVRRPVSLIAIELKGLAAPGEALEN